MAPSKEIQKRCARMEQVPREVVSSVLPEAATGQGLNDHLRKSF